MRVLTGAELEALSQEQLKEVVRDVDIYARTSPEHKIRIVRALQSHDEVVAMTGDGVNDAPALTRANVGIAMGIKGTEATKEAAEVVLADDNFATIRSAIAEGRRIYDNLRKSVVFLLPTNGAQSLVILIAVVFGLTLPLTSVQVLWVNMVTAVTLSLALAYEPAERGIMKRPPRKSGGPIINGQELVFVLIVSFLIGGAAMGVFYGVAGTGVDVELRAHRGGPDARARAARLPAELPLHVAVERHARRLPRQPHDLDLGGRAPRAPAALHLRPGDEHALRIAAARGVSRGSSRPCCRS